jgi:hypothetical protein
MKKEVKCKHEGQYRSAGMATLQSRSGILVLVALYCKDCGGVVLKDMRIVPAGAVPDLSKGVKNV